MSVFHRIARPMLASMFVYGGLDAVRNPRPKVPVAKDVADPLAEALPVDLPDDTEQLIKLNGYLQVGAGALLGIGRFPRASALALAASLVPTTVAGHRFWEAPDDETRNQQLTHFLKNVSMFGGLVIAALDTGGRPSVAWRARRASKRTRRRADRATTAARASAAAAAAQGADRAVRARDATVERAGRTADAIGSALPVGSG
jgi:putative oxidoreductase